MVLCAAPLDLRRLLLFWVSRGHIQQLLLFTVAVLGLKSRIQELLLFRVSRRPFNYLRISTEFTQTSTSCTTCLDNYWFENAAQLVVLDKYFLKELRN